MPIYTYACQCGHIAEGYSTIEGRDSAPDHCGQPVQRIITAPSMVMDDIQPYRSMWNGEMITSRSAHRNQSRELHEHGMVEVGNETKYLFPKKKPRTLPAGVKEELIRQVNQKLRY